MRCNTFTSQQREKASMILQVPFYNPTTDSFVQWICLWRLFSGIIARNEHTSCGALRNIHGSSQLCVFQSHAAWLVECRKVFGSCEIPWSSRNFGSIWAFPLFLHKLVYFTTFDIDPIFFVPEQCTAHEGSILRAVLPTHHSFRSGKL